MLNRQNIKYQGSVLNAPGRLDHKESPFKFSISATMMDER
jgi:hypothetical protein